MNLLFLWWILRDLGRLKRQLAPALPGRRWGWPAKFIVGSVALWLFVVALHASLLSFRDELPAPGTNEKPYEFRPFSLPQRLKDLGVREEPEPALMQPYVYGQKGR